MTAYHSQLGKLWVLVADGEHARILVHGADAGSYRTERRLDSANAHLRTHDMVSDGRGRVHESATTTRHAVEPRTDPHSEAKHQFAVFLADQINQDAAAKHFDRLALVAPAHVMHDLRHALSHEADALLVGFLQKDLVKVPDAEIGPHLTWDVVQAG